MIIKEPIQFSPPEHLERTAKCSEGAPQNQALRSRAADSGYKALRGQHIPVLYGTTAHQSTNTEVCKEKSMKHMQENRDEQGSRSAAGAAPHLGQDKIGQRVGVGLHKHGVLSPCVIRAKAFSKSITGARENPSYLHSFPYQVLAHPARP